jgi:hypothetical protein
MLWKARAKWTIPDPTDSDPGIQVIVLTVLFIRTGGHSFEPKGRVGEVAPEAFRVRPNRKRLWILDFRGVLAKKLAPTLSHPA